MRAYISIDDTDNLDSRGTGEIAELLARGIEENGWGWCSYVTRHQLLVHPDIPYTSHNSAMCFTVELTEGPLDSLIGFAGGFLERECAEGSDPGLCVVTESRLERPDLLMEFGRRAKEVVLTKDAAYGLAGDPGVHLSEHGGTGHGVIGALAGAGLRRGGNDGRLRGSLDFATESGLVTVAQILAHDGVDAVCGLDGLSLGEDGLIRLVDKVKTVLQGGKSVLLVVPDEGSADGTTWRNCTRQQLKRF